MKYFLSAVMAAGWFCLAMAAFAQSASPPQATPGPPQAIPGPAQATSSPAPSGAPASPAAAAANPSAGGGGKRAQCRVSAQGKTGQDRQDQIQLCLAQARVDCLKQAIDQKIANDKRKDFVRSCVQDE